jgi:hypothetical protein
MIRAAAASSGERPLLVQAKSGRTGAGKRRIRRREDDHLSRGRTPRRRGRGGRRIGDGEGDGLAGVAEDRAGRAGDAVHFGIRGAVRSGRYLDAVSAAGQGVAGAVGGCGARDHELGSIRRMDELAVSLRAAEDPVRGEVGGDGHAGATSRSRSGSSGIRN